MHELELIQKAKAGDMDAFCRLYGLYRDRLYRYAFYRLGNSSDAEDAVSECVLSAWAQIGELRQPQAFPAWIFRILSGCCAKMIRQQIRRREEAAARPEDGPRMQHDMRLVLEEALQQLKEEDREIVLLSVIAGCTSAEIGQMTGLAAGSVRSRLSRSLKKMRDFMEEGGTEI